MTEPIFVNDKDDITGRIHDHRDATIADLERQLAAAQRDQQRYWYLKGKAHIENRDGGWLGFFRFPYIDAYRMSANVSESFDYRNNIDAAIDAARGGGK